MIQSDRNLTAAIRVAVVALMATGGASPAQASCNRIPPVVPGYYASDLGMVSGPLGTPGEKLFVKVSACDGDSAPLFSEPADTNQVSIHVIGQDGSRVPLDGVTLLPPAPDCADPDRSGANCCLPDCLGFTVPNLGDNSPAGPAEIVVKNADGDRVVEIGALNRPTKSDSHCDRAPDRTFVHFTMLPRLNDAAALATGGGLVRATVDGDGNLLIPFDFSGVLCGEDGSPVARLFFASATIPAMHAGDSQTILEKFENRDLVPNPVTALRAFRLDGAPLPPLLKPAHDKLSGRSAILGSIDSPASVIRLARVTKDESEPLFDLGDRRIGAAPLAFIPEIFRLEEAVHLDALRSRDNVVMSGIDTGRSNGLCPNPQDSCGPGIGGATGQIVPRIRNLATGEETSTCVVAARVPSAGATVPAIAIGSGATPGSSRVAVIEDDEAGGGHLRLFNEDGDLLLPDEPPLPVELQETVNRTPVVVEAGTSHVFSPPLFGDPSFEVARQTANPARCIDPYDFRSVGIAISPDGHHLYIGPGNDGEIQVWSLTDDGRPNTGSPVQVLQENTGILAGIPLGDEMPGMVIPADGRHIYVSLTEQNAILRMTRDASSGALSAPVVYTRPSGLHAPGRMAVHGDDLYVTAQGSSAAMQAAAVTHFRRDPNTGNLAFGNSYFNGATSGGGTLTLEGAFGVAVSPDGRNVYVGASADARVQIFARGSDGSLTRIARIRNTSDDVTGMSQPMDIQVTPDGTGLYVVSPIDDGLTAFTRDPSSGLVTFVENSFDTRPEDEDADTEFRNTAPFGVGISPDGQHVVAALALDGDCLPDVTPPICCEPATAGPYRRIAVLRRHPGTNELRWLHNVLDVDIQDFRGAWAVAFSRNGRKAHVATFDGIVTIDLARRYQAFDEVSGAAFTTASAPTGVLAGAYGARAVLLRGEDDANADTNGDGDLCDRTLELVDTAGMTPRRVPIPTPNSMGKRDAATEAAIGSSLVAFTIDGAPTSCAARQGVAPGDESASASRVLKVTTIAGLLAGTAVNQDAGIDAEALEVTDHGVLFLSRQRPGGPMSVLPALPDEGQVCPGGTQTTAPERYLYYYYDDDGLPATGMVLHAFDVDAVDFEPGGRVVAFRVNESVHGHVLNADGDCDDDVMMLAELPSPGEHASNGRLVNSTRSAIFCNEAGCLPGVRYKMSDTAVSFLIEEAHEVGRSENNPYGDSPSGDDDWTDKLLGLLDIEAESAVIMSVVRNGDDSLPTASPLPVPLFGGSILVTQVPLDDPNQLHTFVEGDFDEDGLLDSADLCFDVPNAGDTDLDNDGLGDYGCDPGPPPACPAAPLEGCASDVLSQVSVSTGREPDTSSLKWKWSDAESALSAFGDPVSRTSVFDVCVYDDGGLVGSTVFKGAGQCGRKACWRAKDASKVTLRNPVQRGVKKFTAATNSGGTGVKFALGSTTDGAVALPATAPVTVQMIRREAGLRPHACWSSTFTTLDRNDAGSLKALSRTTAP